MKCLRSLRIFPPVLIALVVFLGASDAWALRVSGTGYGKTPDEARKEALAELGQNIRVEVKSSFLSLQTQRNKNLDEMKSKAIRLKSDLPILGVQFSELSAREGFMAEAILTSSSAGLYEKELLNVSSQIAKNLDNLKSAMSADARAGFLRGILTQVEQYYSLRIVAQFLKCETIPDIAVTAEDIAARLADLEKKADSVAFGAKLLAKNFTAENIYIFPPTPKNSSEVTPFGSAVKDHLAPHLKTVAHPDRAQAFLTGTYALLKDGLELTCHLADGNHKVLASNVVFFTPEAYKSYPVEPVSLDFEKLVAAGHVVSGDFKVDIKTTQGNSDLLFKKGESLKILVKMNKPGYFYLVSHNFKKNNYSCIINFSEEPGNRKFVSYVDGDSANRWIELGDFEVVAPFGVETLQMVASTDDLVASVPPTFFDKETGLYTISDALSKTGRPLASEPGSALSATRGLILKKKSATSEAVLVFTSMD